MANNIDSESKPRRRLRLRGKLLGLLILILALGLSFFLGAVLTHRDSAPTITTDLISQQLNGIQELATVEYYYTNMGQYENQLDFYGWKVPFTTKRFILSYDAVIKAGVDLSALDVRVTGDTITITLPEPEILSHEIPEDSIQVFDETHNIFNPIQISDYTGFTRDQKALLEERAIENGLLDKASEQACTVVENLLELLPGIEHYQLTVSCA